MTIACPAEFSEAVKFAMEADEALEAEILRTGDAERRRALEEKRGQAARTLLQAFGYRAESDKLDNEKPYFPETTEIRYQDWTVRPAKGMSKYALPMRETFIYSDWAPHSFFFRELWVDARNRQIVEVFDKCWYIFEEGTSQEAADEMTDEELEEAVKGCSGREVVRTFNSDMAAEAIASHRTCVGTMRMRVGMCGGIVYHADYWPDKGRLPFGSWSTHT